MQEIKFGKQMLQATDWFNGADHRPAEDRPGVYQTCYTDDAATAEKASNQTYRYWDGSYWYVCVSTPSAAVSSFEDELVQKGDFPGYWRGVLK